MSKKPCLVLSVILTATMLLTACAPAAAPAAALAAPVQPTIAQVTTAAAPTTAAVQPDGPSIKVGLVTDTGGVNDKAFNQLAWEGLQKASKQPTDYEKNIDAFATEGYNVIITVGSLMGDATALKAKQYPNIKREQNRTSSKQCWFLLPIGVSLMRNRAELAKAAPIFLPLSRPTLHFSSAA